MTDPTSAGPAHLLPRLAINTALARRILVLFLRDAVRKTGFQRAVVGLRAGWIFAVVPLVDRGAWAGNGARDPHAYRTSSQASLTTGGGDSMRSA